MNLTTTQSKNGKQHFTYVVPTKNLRALILKHFIKRGFKYFVSWKDTRGWGILGCNLADWQTPDSAIYHNK